MHAFTKFKFAKRVFLLLSEKIGISYKSKNVQIQHLYLHTYIPLSR